MSLYDDHSPYLGKSFGNCRKRACREMEGNAITDGWLLVRDGCELCRSSELERAKTVFSKVLFGWETCLQYEHLDFNDPQENGASTVPMFCVMIARIAICFLLVGVSVFLYDGRKRNDTNVWSLKSLFSSKTR